MDWEFNKHYLQRQILWSNVLPNVIDEVIDDMELSIFSHWLLAQKGLRLSRRIATFELYEFSRSLISRDRLIYIEAERVMLGLTPKVLRGWNGEWQVFDPPKTLGIEKHLTWRVICERLSSDTRDDPVCFRFAKSDYKGELPAGKATPQATPAKILSFSTARPLTYEDNPSGDLPT